MPLFCNVGGSDKDYGNNEARPGSMTWISGTDNIEYKKHCTCLIGIMKVEYFTGYGNWSEILIKNERIIYEKTISNSIIPIDHF